MGTLDPHRPPIHHHPDNPYVLWITFSAMQLLTLTTALLASTATAKSLWASSPNISPNTDGSLSVPGENPLQHCEDPKNDILTLKSVDLTPNPPNHRQRHPLGRRRQGLRSPPDGQIRPHHHHPADGRPLRHHHQSRPGLSAKEGRADRTDQVRGTAQGDPAGQVQCHCRRVQCR